MVQFIVVSAGGGCGDDDDLADTIKPLTMEVLPIGQLGVITWAAHAPMSDQ